MEQKVLITGISGFAGSHLAELLVSKNQYKICGTYLSDRSLQNLKQVKGRVELVSLNLLDKEKTEGLIASFRPDAVFHLAAMPAVGGSFERPAEIMTNNTTAQINLLEAVIKSNLSDCRILIVSSADVYGKVAKEDIPIDEETPFMPTNTYAVSKIAQDFLGLQYFISYNLKIIRARPFNHIGPRQSVGFVVADFAKRIAEIEKGKEEPLLQVGNLNSKRDFTDVRDIVRAYSILIQKDVFGEVYNIGSGTSHKIEDILLELVSLAKIPIEITVDATILRRGDAPERICDNRKFKKLTDWSPTISLNETLKDTLDYWRAIV